MDNRHPWCQRLLTPLPDEALKAPVAADDPLWEKIETELVKLGSLAHSQLNLTDVASDCLTLLESKTKDMRVLVQLLRCLQHPAKAEPFATALILLDCWLNAWWPVAWPVGGMQKQRLMSQMIKRFEGVQERMCERASAAELTRIVTLTEQLANSWLAIEPGQSTMLDGLLSSLRRAQQRLQEQAAVNKTPAAAPVAAVTTSSSASALDIDSSNERSWRQTQLKVADLLLEQQPEAAVGYRLRRHAIWHTITTAPVSGKAQKTQLAPVALDRVNEYEAALAQADHTLWRQIEESLTLSPFWFDGHRLSAQAAARLGCHAVAEAIAAELQNFLQRLPALKTLCFNDGSAFLPPACAEWLQSATASNSAGGQGQDLAAEVKTCRQKQGLNAALLLLEEKTHHQAEPRDRFYAGMMLAELLAAEGMKTLATAHYQQLWQEAQRLGLMQWEPALVKRLERFAPARG